MTNIHGASLTVNRDGAPAAQRSSSDTARLAAPRPVPANSAEAGLRFFDAEAEKKVLGAMIGSAEVVRALAGEVRAEYFLEAHQIILRAILHLWDTGTPLDLVTVTRQLHATGELDRAGGPYALACLDLFPSIHLARHCLVLLRDLWRKREAARIAQQLHEEVGAGAELSVFDDAWRRVEELRREDGAQLTPIMSLAAGPEDPRATVLGDRFLCLGGAMLFVGPSGIGKSSASMQQDILWSLGREAFGIRPARPLKILTIQAENDARDLAEMRDGVCRGLELGAEDRAAVNERVFYETENSRVGEDFVRFVESRLRLRQFDLLRIDPFQAYLGGDPKETEVTAAFLRQGLSRLLTRYGVACVLNHHTPKTTNRDTSLWRANDWMYAGAGSADITNWARAMLVIDPTHCGHVFRFIAAKRGGRIGWRDEAGERERVRNYCHSTNGLFWREATPEDIEAAEEAARQTKGGGNGHATTHKTAADLKALVPMTGTVAKESLIATARNNGFSKERARAALQQMLEKGELFEIRVPRPGTNAQVRISRQEPDLLRPCHLDEDEAE